MQEACAYSSKVMIDSGKYQDYISYLSIVKLKDNSKLSEKDVKIILENSLQSNCLNYFNSYNNKNNLSDKFLYKFIKKKLGSSKVSSTKKKLKNIDVIFYIEASSSSFKIELYNTRLDLIAKYHNKKLTQSINNETIMKMLDNFYSRYFFKAINILKDDRMTSDDSVIINGKKFGEVKDYELDDLDYFLVDGIPRNIKSYMQIESDNSDKISNKHFIEPEEIFLKRKNKKRIPGKIKADENIEFSYRNKTGAFKIKIVDGLGSSLDHLNANVKLKDLFNLNGIETNMVVMNDNLIVLTNEKFQKKWNYNAIVTKDGYPSTLAKKVALVDSSSYQLFSNPAIEFLVSEESQLKTYFYNSLLPGIGALYAGDNEQIERLKSRDRRERSFLDNHKLVSYLTMPTYVISTVSLISNFSDYSKYKDEYDDNLLLYNSTGLGQYKDLTNQYYDKAVTAEENIYKFAFISLAVNIFSNYYLNSKWFKWK